MSGNNKKIRSIVIVAILAVFGIVVYQSTMSNLNIAWDNITPEELERRLPPNDFLLIDVRQPSEFKEGHIPGATLIPLNRLKKELVKIDQEKEVVVYCLSGNRSAQAAALLAGYGFSNIKNLTVGIQGWRGKIER